MAKKIDKKLIVALDIGTSKVVAVIGEEREDGQVEIIGHGYSPSRGMKRGVVVNIEKIVTSIQKAVEEAELVAGCQVNSVFTGIAGGHINGINSHGIVAIRGHEVEQSDIDRVIDAARAVAIPADQQILHILAQEFVIDQQPGITEPMGMSGVRLESKVHIVTCAASAIQNINKCVQSCGIKSTDIILEALASSYAVLSDDEKDLGVCMVDIGSGTADIAIYTEGAIRHTKVIPIAGDQVTNDLAVAFRIPVKIAEKLKLNHGTVNLEKADSQRLIDIPPIAEKAGRTVSQQEIAHVMEARYEEVFSMVRNELHQSGYGPVIASGVILTGGAALADGVIRLAEKTLGMPVRLATAKNNLQGAAEIVDNPVYSTVLGLLLYGRQQQHESRYESYKAEQNGMKGLLGKMKHWLQVNL